jgi:hypothetical protein
MPVSSTIARRAVIANPDKYLLWSCKEEYGLIKQPSLLLSERSETPWLDLLLFEASRFFIWNLRKYH